MTNVVLFSEDALIERAARKIIAVKNPAIQISNVMGRRGFSYLKSRVREIRRSASALKFLIFLDGDELGTVCPADAIAEWFETDKPKNIHVRFAFHEVESWILADRKNLADFLSIKISDVPIVDDRTRDAKEILVRISRASRRREIVEDMVPARGFTSKVGPAFATKMSEFIGDAWDIDIASGTNESLARACRCIEAIK